MTAGDLFGGIIAAFKALAHAHLKDVELGHPWLLLSLVRRSVVVAIAVVGSPLPTLSFARGEQADKLPRGAGHAAQVPFLRRRG